MSLPAQEPDSFSHINTNAIKNFKLFQKFMQNKSGLLPSNINTINKTTLVKSNLQGQNIQPQQRKESHGHQKWPGSDNIRKNEQADDNQRRMVVNLKKDPSHNANIRKQLQNDINTQNSYPYEQYHPSKPYEQSQHREQTKHVISRFPNPRRQQYQQSLVEPYQSQRLKQQDLQYYQSNKPKMYQIEPQIVRNGQSFGGPSHLQSENNPPQKRKRNYNPFGNNTEKINENVKNSPPKQPSSDSNTFPQDNYSEAIRENLPNKATTMDQKYVKVQFSPGRSNNTYPHNYTMNHQNYIEPTHNEQFIHQHASINPTSVQYSESEYKQKYDQLHKKYEQLKFQLKNESKHRKKEFSEWEHQIQQLKQKLFDVQSRQDSLLIQNQRLKDKFQGENLTKMKTQQENKELTFRIKELEDQLQMKESNVKQKYDETNYWKAQVDSMKQELNMLRLGLEKKIDEYNLLFGDYQIVKKQRDNKDYLLDDMRKNINSLVEENSLAKDEIFKLVTKLYQMQQENQILRNDLKRQQLDTSQIHNYMKELKDQSQHINRDRLQSSYMEKGRQPQQNMYEPHINPMERSNGQHRNQNMGYRNDVQINNRELTGARGSLTDQEKPMNNKPTRRRGEFARERGQVTKNQKLDKDQYSFPLRQNPQHQKSIGQERTLPTNSHSTANKAQNFNNNNNKYARIQQISQELQKIKDMKAMNGAIRRKKIDLERELQELQEKMH